MNIKMASKSTKKEILKASSKIIAQKGFMDSNLSEIAHEAGVRETTIYQYYKGKEDLLFSAAELDMEEPLFFLNEHLQGISGAYNKLRKFIWAHLRYSDTNKEYMTLLLFDCRTNQNFYKSVAYQSIRKYAGVLFAILEEGVKEEVFRSDLNIRLVRDIIFGLMDFEAIRCLVTHEKLEAVSDYEKIMELIERMLLSKYRCKIPPMEKGQRILWAAVQAFAEKGYSSATISEIARLAGIAEGTVYEYFKNKEDLLFCIAGEHFQDSLHRLEENFDVKNPIMRLRFFLQHHFQQYVNDINFLIVFLTLIFFNRQFYQSRAYDSMRTYDQALEELVQKVIDDIGVGKDIDIRIFQNMFLGAFNHMALRWFVSNQGEHFDKMEELNKVIEYIIDTLVTYSNPQNLQ